MRETIASLTYSQALHEVSMVLPCGDTSRHVLGFLDWTSCRVCLVTIHKAFSRQAYCSESCFFHI